MGNGVLGEWYKSGMECTLVELMDDPVGDRDTNKSTPLLSKSLLKVKCYILVAPNRMAALLMIM